jgi:NAD(P)H-nitrite reductase large subunit
MLTELFAIGSGLTSLATENTTICRCEEVTKKEIQDVIEMGCDSLIWVKRMTRTGMGMCQGRICGQWIARLIAEQAGQDPTQMMLDTVRPPVRPIPMCFQKVSDNDQTS